MTAPLPRARLAPAGPGGSSRRGRGRPAGDVCGLRLVGGARPARRGPASGGFFPPRLASGYFCGIATAHR
jgi:hypothetical protein